MRTEEEKKLRRLLAIQHSHREIGGYSYMYFDDGEMQCVICKTDFLRDSAEQIEEAMRKYNMKVLNESCTRTTEKA